MAFVLVGHVNTTVHRKTEFRILVNLRHSVPWLNQLLSVMLSMPDIILRLADVRRVPCVPDVCTQ